MDRVLKRFWFGAGKWMGPLVWMSISKVKSGSCCLPILHLLIFFFESIHYSLSSLFTWRAQTPQKCKSIYNARVVSDAGSFNIRITVGELISLRFAVGESASRLLQGLVVGIHCRQRLRVLLSLYLNYHENLVCRCFLLSGDYLQVFYL